MIVSAASLAFALALGGPAAAALDDLDLISRATDGAPALGPSMEPAISADGRLVAFTSQADNLSDADADGTSDVFVRDLVAGTTVLVSRASGPGGAGGDAGSSAPSISADGRFVAFQSNATNLAAGVGGDNTGVFVRDLRDATTTLVSATPGGEVADGGSRAPSISADGRFVAFHSAATNLSGEDEDGATDVFVRDLASGAVTLASRADGPAGAPGDLPSIDAAISADGRRVAFQSDADNLSTADLDLVPNIFVRDLAAHRTILVSRPTGEAGPPAFGASVGAQISGDGRIVGFASSANGLSDEDDDSVQNVFVRDIESAVTTLVSRAPGLEGAGGDRGSGSLALSGDGRRVAFYSEADNLSPDDASGGAGDIFVRDLPAGTTTLVSRAAGAAGAAADEASYGPLAITPDARFVAFASDADNLSAVDDDSATDVFRRDVLGDPPGAGPATVAPAGPAPERRAACAGRPATIVGTPGRDVIRGTSRRDVIAALGGNDIVRGLAGADLICLGAGADRAFGGAGPDRILGGPGRDRIAGGPGRDRLAGGPGRDALRGQAGRDSCLSGRRLGCERSISRVLRRAGREIHHAPVAGGAGATRWPWSG